MYRPSFLTRLPLVTCVGLGLALTGAAAAPASPPSDVRYAGRPLEEALLDLRRQGLKIVFTSRVVRPDMAVEVEPTAREPRQILDELLAPHRLRARAGPGGTVVVVPGEREANAEEPSLPVVREELVVTPSRISLLREEPVAFFGFSRDEILTLPRLGDDFLRSLTLLPGTAGNDVTAQFHVRGGRRDETQILLDGQELYEPFHLRDFDNAVSAVAPATLAEAELITGGFSAQYGDRMSGVLDMTTVTPSGSPRLRLGAGTAGAHAGGSGAFNDGRGAWIAEMRRGTTDAVGRLLDREDPRYWDAFAKLDYQLRPDKSLRVNLLHIDDALRFAEDDGEERKRFATEYMSSYAWLTWQTVVNQDLVVETAGSWVGIDRDRRGLEVEEEERFSILDARDAQVFGLRQGWTLQATPTHLLQWGWQVRRFETDYDYFGTREFDTPLAQLRHDAGQESTIFRHRFWETHSSVYLTDRMRLLEPLTLELGLRYDHYSQTEERHRHSPRLNLAYALSERSVVRVAWGRFNQSQRPYELQVEDGEREFHPLERSEHRVLGFERLFDRSGSSQGLALRAEVYQREVFNPRPRYENLFEPLNMFPEVEPDRVRVAPRRSIAEGIEFFLRGGLGERATWWVNYAYARTEDEIDGTRVPRLFDQTHGLNLNLDWRISERWRLDVAWRYHTGWPTTPLQLRQGVSEEGEAEWVPELGRLNSERLPVYHRLDLRASRNWRWRRASVDFFVDVQNVYDRRNVGGFDFDVDEESGALLADSESWPGILPSVGVSLEF